MTADAAERLARVRLALAAEPGEDALAREVAEHGAAELVARLLDGRVPVDGAARLTATLGERDPVAELSLAGSLGVRVVVPGDLEWPSQLDDLSAPPLALWVRGLDLRTCALRSVAVVGSRAASGYGSHVAGELAATVAGRGWTVVSGLAFGIDAAAHRGALAAGGRTIGVLACGVDVAYPQANAALAQRVTAQGCLVSELPLGSRPHRHRLLQRNRLIACLSRATVVVEAALRSGALSTAAWARDLNRPVLGVPGPVTSDLSAGVHREIRERGALLVTGGQDVTELLEPRGDGADGRARGGTGAARPATTGNRPPAARGLPLLLGYLPAGTPLALDALAESTGLTRVELREDLTALAAAGLVVAGPEGYRLAEPPDRTGAPPRGDA